MMEVSNCCKAKLIEDFKDNPNDHHDPFEIYTCEKCKKECDAIEVCEYCQGDGYIQNEDGYNERCVCNPKGEEADMDDDS
jgi:hypothetical protein